MPISTGWSRAPSTSTHKPATDPQNEQQLRCGGCGMPYRRRSFQVVVLPDLEAFDRTECATAPRASGYPHHHRRHRELSDLEGLAAELFMTRAALEKERRAYAELQRAHERLAKDIAADKFRADASAPAVRYGRAAASGGGS
jgi:hypothetical protein